MRRPTQRRLTTFFVLGVYSATFSASGAEPFVGGVEPQQRPEAAPVVKTVDKDAAWYARALHGLQPPHPASFRFLEDQGNWSTPFTKPGMPGPYDLRGWHAKPAK